MPTVGTHNLQDEAGTATAFAHVLFFTESVAAEVLKQLPDSYEVAVCRWQKDLIIAWDPAFFRPKRDKKGRVKGRYHLNNPGLAKVTPHRGTFWIKGEVLHLGIWRKTALICAHWINAAFPPFRRGEKLFRQATWRKHRRFTKKLIERLERQGYLVLGGGDFNTPYGEDAFFDMPQVEEVGLHFDRLFAVGYDLKRVKYMAKKGSDHPRLRALAA